MSSSESWAESDLYDLMRGASVNAPLFIEAFYDGCRELAKRETDLELPDAAIINRMLHQFDTGYEIHSETLVRTDQHPDLTTELPVATFLNEEAQRIVRESLDLSSRMLSEGRHRQAVQEVLWLLETVTTAFAGLQEGDATVTGKYFNEISRSLRKRSAVVSWSRS